MLFTDISDRLESWFIEKWRFSICETGCVFRKMKTGSKLFEEKGVKNKAPSIKLDGAFHVQVLLRFFQYTPHWGIEIR